MNPPGSLVSAEELPQPLYGSSLITAMVLMRHAVSQSSFPLCDLDCENLSVVAFSHFIAV